MYLKILDRFIVSFENCIVARKSIQCIVNVEPLIKYITDIKQKLTKAYSISIIFDDSSLDVYNRNSATTHALFFRPIKK